MDDFNTGSFDPETDGNLSDETMEAMEDMDAGFDLNSEGEEY